METDLSNYINSGVYFQLDDSGLLYLIIIFSKNLSLLNAIMRSMIKLLAIIRYFEQWKPKLEVIGMLVKVITDHKSLEYFMTSKKITRYQACWTKFLSKFNFIISYILDKKNQRVDLLTHCPNDLSSDDNNN